ncbi:hypothetical protein STEG23_022435, partial [Scotinomys teguina]
TDHGNKCEISPGGNSLYQVENPSTVLLQTFQDHFKPVHPHSICKGCAISLTWLTVSCTWIS